MAVIIRTNKPEQLHADFKKAIRELRIETWIVDRDGDFTVERERWRNHAWMRYYKIDEDSIAFGIVESRKYPLVKDLYGIMHGRLVATLLTHFDNLITNIEITSKLDDKYDIFNKERLFCN